MRLAQCEVVTEDEVHAYIAEGGLVTIMGESPTATAKLSKPGDGKYVMVDILRSCVILRDGETYKIRGRSDHLKHVIQSPTTELTLMVSPGPPCEDCP